MQVHESHPFATARASQVHTEKRTNRSPLLWEFRVLVIAALGALLLLCCSLAAHFTKAYAEDDPSAIPAYFYIGTETTIPYGTDAPTDEAFIPRGEAKDALTGTLKQAATILCDPAQVTALLQTKPGVTTLDIVFRANHLSYDLSTERIVWYSITPRNDPTGSFNVFGAKIPKDSQLVFYDPNGGSSDVPAGSAYKVGEEVTVNLTGPIPMRNGYDFLGWSMNRNAPTAEFAATDPTAPTFTMPADTVTLYAIWRQKDATVTYEAVPPEGGSLSTASETIGALNGIAAGCIAAEAPGYVFAGWYQGNELISSDAELPSTIATKHLSRKDGIAENTVFTAKFEAVPPQFTYVVFGAYPAEGGLVSSSYSIISLDDAEGLQPITAEPTEGYEFEGWYKDDDRVEDDPTLTVQEMLPLLNHGRTFAPTMFIAHFEPEHTTTPTPTPTPDLGNGSVSGTDTPSTTPDGAGTPVRLVRVLSQLPANGTTTEDQQLSGTLAKSGDDAPLGIGLLALSVLAASGTLIGIWSLRRKGSQ